MKLIKIIGKILFLFFFLCLMALIIFYYWASSGTVPKEELSTQKSYPKWIISTNKEKTRFKVMTYNIGYLSGMANNLPIKMGKHFFDSNLKKFISILKQKKPDLIALQEIDYHSKRSYYTNQLETIARNLHYPFSVQAINWDKRYVPFPYWPPAAHFGRILSGQAVLSVYPILSSQRIVLKMPDNKPFYYRAFYLDRLVQSSKIKIGSKTLVILNIHLEAFEQKTREKQALSVLNIYQLYKNQFPVLILGDFNSIPPKSKIKFGFPDEPDMDFSTDNTIHFFLREKSLKEVILSNSGNIPESSTFTFPSHKPNRKLDYIFYNADKIICLNAYVLNLDCSDHLPVIMEFSFKN